MSIVGRRRSSESDWNWSRPPLGPRRPPPRPPLLPLAGAGLIALFVALALLGLWLSDGDDNSPAGAAKTPTATPAITATLSPSPTPAQTPAPTPTATPSATPAPTVASPVPGSQAPLFRLAAWDGQRWEANPPLEGPTYREGEAVPFLLRVDQAGRGAARSLTIRYDCQAFALLTSYDRDHGSGPALASGGPESAIADATLSIPDDAGTAADDGEAGSLSLWGGTFTEIAGPLPPSACRDEKALTVGLTALADTFYLMWAAEISAGAAGRGSPLRLAVQAPGAEELSIEIQPESVAPPPP